MDQVLLIVCEYRRRQGDVTDGRDLKIGKASFEARIIDASSRFPFWFSDSVRLVILRIPCSFMRITQFHQSPPHSLRALHVPDSR